MKIYHNPRCSKSRETLALIKQNGIRPEIILYLDKPLNEEELETILSKLKIPAEQLVRKSESIYKEQFKGKKLTEKQWISALVKHPKLIERPIVIKGKKAILGRPPTNVIALI